MKKKAVKAIRLASVTAIVDAKGAYAEFSVVRGLEPDDAADVLAALQMGVICLTAKLGVNPDAVEALIKQKLPAPASLMPTPGVQ